jgi:hypothetical protein
MTLRSYGRYLTGLIKDQDGPFCDEILGESKPRLRDVEELLGGQEPRNTT